MMSKKSKAEKRGDRGDLPAHPPGKISTKVYEAEIARLQEELAHLQAWVQKTGARIVIIFEGRDAAGKGGLIKRITEKVSRPLIPLTLKVASFIPTERSARQDVPLD